MLSVEFCPRKRAIPTRNFTRKLLTSVSVTAFLVALAAAPKPASAVCPTSTPASNSTVTCTFTVDGAGDAIYDTTGIQAPNSTGVTLNINGTIAGEFETGGIITPTPPSIDVGSGVRITISDAEITSGDIAAIEAEVGGNADVDFDTITNQVQFDAALNGVAALGNPVTNFAGATIQLGAPLSLAAIQSDIDAVINVVTVKKAAINDHAMNSITAVQNATPLPGLLPVLSGTAVTSASSNQLVIDNVSLVSGAGSDVIAAQANSANHIEISGESLVASAGQSAPAVFLAGGGALEVVVDDGSIFSIFDGSAGIESGAASALSVQLTNSNLFTTGDQSAGIFADATGSSLLFEARGQTLGNPVLATYGNNSAGVDFSGEGNSTATIDIANVNDMTFGPAFRTLGDNSALFKMHTSPNGTSSFSFSGVNGAFSTAGAGSAIFDLDLGTNSDMLIFAQGSTFTTSGANSDIVGINLGNSSVTNLVTIDSSMTTTGNGSGGIVVNGLAASNSLTMFNSGLDISTSGNDAPGIFVEGLGATSNLSASTFDSTIATIGNNSAGFFLGPLGNFSAMEDLARNVTITTQGNNSPGYVSSQTGMGSAKTTSANNVTITTQGNNSNGFEFGGANGDNSVASFDMTDIMLETNGDNSTGLLWRFLAGSSSTEVGSFDQIDVVTRGVGSAGIILGQQDAASQHGGAITAGSKTLVADNVTVRTEGADSAGVLVSGYGDNTSITDVQLLFENFDIETQGDRSIGLEVHALGNGAFGSLSTFVFDAINVTTAGSDAVGVILDTGAGLTPGALSELQTAFNQVTIQTSGDRAHGLILGSGMGIAGTIFVAGINNSAITTGADANALVISPNTVLADHGGNADSFVTANFFDTFVATGAGGRSIQNDGTIEGGADGLVLTPGLGLVGNIANSGLITATGPVAVQYDTAANTNDIFELQPGGVVNGTVEAGNGTDSFILGGEGAASFDYTLLDVQYNGFDNFIKEDGSTWTLTGPGSASFNKPGTITGGTLVINPVLAAFDVTTDTDGTLAGTGGIGSLQNAGTFAPGNNGVGMFSIANNLTLNAGGTFEVDILADGTSDIVDVGGMVALDGTIAVNGVGYPVNFPDKQEYVVVQTKNAINGGFDTITDNLPDVNAMVTITQATAATMTDPAMLGTVVVGYERAADESDKSIFSNSLQVAASAGRLFTETLQRRGAIEPALLGGASDQNADGLMTIGRHDRGSVKDGIASRFTDTSFGRFALWAGGMAAYTDVDATTKASGYDARTGGFASGIEMLSGYNGTLLKGGIAFGRTEAGLDSGLSDGSVGTWHIGGHLTLARDAVELSGALGYGFQDSELSRTIPLAGGAPAIAKSDVDGRIFSASLGLSYDLARGQGFAHGFKASPFFALDHVNARQDAFTETGAGILNQSVAGSSFQRTYLGVGVKFSGAYMHSNGTQLTPEFQILYQRGFGDDYAATTSSIIGVTGANFLSQGARLGDNTVRLGAGLGFELDEKTSGHIRYDGGFSAEESDHRGSLGFTVKY